jgi:hypothetical protein
LALSEKEFTDQLIDLCDRSDLHPIEVLRVMGGMISIIAEILAEKLDSENGGN